MIRWACWRTQGSKDAAAPSQRAQEAWTLGGDGNGGADEEKQVLWTESAGGRHLGRERNDGGRLTPSFWLQQQVESGATP